MPPMTSQALIENMKAFAEHYPEENMYTQRLKNFEMVAQGLRSSKSHADILAENAQNTYPILDHTAVTLIKDFLFFNAKQNDGTESKEFYLKAYPELANITSPNAINEETVQKFVARLLEKRPLTFYTSGDLTKDRPNATSSLTKTGQGYVDSSLRKAPTSDYISYDEMQIAALLQVSSPSLFINDGDRYNEGEYKSGNRDFIPQGIMVGSVGARFEDPPGAGHMEYQHMLVTPTQNTAENGYGSAATPEQKAHLSHWAKFYQLDYFPSYQEAKQIYESENPPQSGSKPKAEQSYIHIGDNYLNVAVYKARMRKVIESFLIEANARATAEKKAYVHAVGLGTGVWAQDATQQEKLILEVYAEVLKEHEFPHIADLDFSYFKPQQFNGKDVREAMLALLKEGPNKQINIFFSKNNPSGYGEVKTKEYLENKTLVVQYAWDGGSFPGNEYWVSNLTGSGDPAAACASQIAELQNPLINPQFTQKCRITNGSALKPLTVDPKPPITVDPKPPTGGGFWPKSQELLPKLKKPVTPPAVPASTPPARGAVPIPAMIPPSREGVLGGGAPARGVMRPELVGDGAPPPIFPAIAGRGGDRRRGAELTPIPASLGAAASKLPPIRPKSGAAALSPSSARTGSGTPFIMPMLGPPEADVAAQFKRMEQKLQSNAQLNKYSTVKSFQSNPINNGMILTFDSEQAAQEFAAKIPVKSLNGENKKPFYKVQDNGQKIFCLNFTKEQTHELMRYFLAGNNILPFSSEQTAKDFAAAIAVKVSGGKDKEPFIKHQVRGKDFYPGKYKLNFTPDQKDLLCGKVTLNHARTFIENKKFLEDSSPTALTDRINLLAYSWGIEIDNNPYKEDYEKYKKEFIGTYSKFSSPEKCNQIINSAMREHIINSIETYNSNFVTGYKQAFKLLNLDKTLDENQYKKSRTIMQEFVNILQKVNTPGFNLEKLQKNFNDILNEQFKGDADVIAQISAGFEKIFAQIQPQPVSLRGPHAQR